MHLCQIKGLTLTKFVLNCLLSSICPTRHPSYSSPSQEGITLITVSLLAPRFASPTLWPTPHILTGTLPYPCKRKIKVNILSPFHFLACLCFYLKGRKKQQKYTSSLLLHPNSPPKRLVKIYKKGNFWNFILKDLGKPGIEVLSTNQNQFITL